MDGQRNDLNDERTAERARELTPEETSVGVDDPGALAAEVLADSDKRTEDRDAAPDTLVEHRQSEDKPDA